PPGAALVLLLAPALPDHDVPLATVPEPAGVGRVRGPHLLHDLAPLLVHRAGPGLRHPARPLAKPSGALHLRHARHGLARLGTPLAPLRDGLSPARRPRHAARRLAAHGGELPLRRGPAPRLAPDPT